MPFDLVQFPAEDGHPLFGLYTPAAASIGQPSAAIYVHGTFGNFYRDPVVPELASAFAKRGMAFLTFNQRTHDCVVESYRPDQSVKYMGGSIASWDESLEDLVCAVRYCRARGARRIVLVGHSTGCDKIVGHCRRGGEAPGAAVFLAPVDRASLQRRYIEPETIEQQLDRLSRLKPPRFPTDLLSPIEHGVKVGSRGFYSPITWRALMSQLQGMIEQPPARWKASLGQLPLLLCLAGRDPLGEAETYWRRELGDGFDVLHAGAAGHNFETGVAELAVSVAAWAAC